MSLGSCLLVNRAAYLIISSQIRKVWRAHNSPCLWSNSIYKFLHRAACLMVVINVVGNLENCNQKIRNDRDWLVDFQLTNQNTVSCLLLIKTQLIENPSSNLEK